jgi:hypothetical protein
MKAGQTLRALGLVFALGTAAYAQSQQPDPPPRRPQGPAAGPVIKLPPGSGATQERPQTPGAKEQAAPAPSQPQKWEYCSVNAIYARQKSFGIGSSTQVFAARVRYLPEGSEEVEGASEEEALGNALARLGEDGWELTAIRTDLHLVEGGGRTTSVYFFKRPKTQE